jgi:hypothetical protein
VTASKERGITEGNRQEAKGKPGFYMVSIEGVSITIPKMEIPRLHGNVVCACSFMCSQRDHAIL